MGQDKRCLIVNGVPMLSVALGLAASVADDLIISCRRDDVPAPELYAGQSVRLVFDRREGGPLAGLEAALPAVRHDLTVVLPIDMPGLTRATLSALVTAALAQPDAQAAVFADQKGWTPFPCLYRRSVLPILSAQLDAGALRVGDLLARLDLALVAPDPITSPEKAFLNVNTAADLARSEGDGSGRR